MAMRTGVPPHAPLFEVKREMQNPGARRNGNGHEDGSRDRAAPRALYGEASLKASLSALRRRRAAAERTAVKGVKRPPPLPPLPEDGAQRAALDERLLAAFELLETGVFDWDVASGRVRYFRPGQDLTDRVPAQLLTTADEWFETAHADDLPLASAAVDRALRGEAEAFQTFYRRRKGEEWSYVQSAGKVIGRGADGRALRVIGVYRDLTTPVSAERGRLAREAAAREAQLRATLTEFASSLAHELNQPLAALSANAQAALRLLDSGPSGRKDAREALVRSVALAERAADVVRAMRQLLRPESRSEEPVDLADVARDVCDLVDPEARRADVVLRVSRPKAPVVVTADRGQIELLLLNLVRNAIEAISAARPARRQVEVRVRPGRSKARLEVDDTGPGVDPAVRDRIFDAYFTTKTDGTGLGLRLCRTFAEAHGGRLVCAPDRPRKGALFILELPPDGPGPSGRARSRPARRGRAPRG